MAKFVQIYENRIEKKVLTFRGKEFTITMIENEYGATSLEKCLDVQLEEAFPDDENLEEICELVDGIEYDDMDRLDNLEELESYE